MDSSKTHFVLEFDPENPFPVTPEGFVHQPDQSAQMKRHSADVDRWLGLSSETIEARLIQSKSYTSADRDREFWIGKSIQVFQTPYVELREILEALELSEGDSIVDLGAGYGRMAHILGRHFSGVSFKGYEYVLERCEEGRAAFARSGLLNACLENTDVTTLDFFKESAKHYFIYDFGSREDIETVLENMREALSQTSIIVVARGGRSRDIIDKKHLWLSYAVRPLHRGHYSIYRSQPSTLRK